MNRRDLPLEEDILASFPLFSKDREFIPAEVNEVLGEVMSRFR